MSATDELRKLLDERGVEWTYADGTVSFANNGHWCHAWAYSDNAMCVSMGYFTPEQAIAATLDNSKSNIYKKIIEAKSARIEELRRDRDSLRSACNIGDEIIESLQSMNDQKNKRISELEALAKDLYENAVEFSFNGWIPYYRDRFATLGIEVER